MASLPYPIPHTNAFMLHTPSKHYLVISESRIHYFLVDDFDVCRRCSSMEPIYISNTECCELALYLQKNSVSDLSQNKLLKTFRLYLSGKTKDGFIHLVL